MKKILILVSVIVYFILSSCIQAEYYDFTRLSLLDIGMDKESVSEIIGDYYYEGKTSQGDFVVKRRLLTGSYHNYDIFYFENNSLLYWGNIVDFQNHDKINIRKAGEEISPILLDIVW